LLEPVAHRWSRSLLVAALVAAAVVRATWAFHDEPRRARTFKATLVTAYVPCTSPNTVTTGVPALPACYPAVRSDPVCGFQSANFLDAGFGRASGKSRTSGDIQVIVSAKGLAQGCEGQTLCGLVTVRATTHRCAQGPCTVPDVTFTGSTPTACCVVTNGNCYVSTTIDSEVLGTLVAGDRTGVEVLGCGLRRVTGPSLPSFDTFHCGTLTP
jgi:hypothetical protein